MTELSDIENRAADLRKQWDKVSDALSRMDAEISAVRKAHMVALRPMIKKLVSLRSTLNDTIEANPQLFERPRSQTMHGIKLGFQKQRGKTVIKDAAKTVALIRKHLSDKFEQLVKVTETPDKTAIGKLTGNELKKIGVRVEDDTDDVVLKPIESETEKLINALLKEVEQDR